MVHAFQFKEVAHLFQGVRFQLDFHAGLFLTQPVDAFLEVFRISIRHQVVVFHHGTVIKAHAVVGASAMEHGRFFQQTVAGSGFAGIQNAGAGVGNGFHILSGERSYSGKTLDEVEGGAFRPKNGAGGTFNKHHHGAGRHGFPVMQVNFHLQGGIHLAENFRRDIDAGKNAFFPGGQNSSGCQMFRDEVCGSHVAGAEVFGQRQIDQGFHVVGYGFCGHERKAA